MIVIPTLAKIIRDAQNQFRLLGATPAITLHMRVTTHDALRDELLMPPDATLKRFLDCDVVVEDSVLPGMVIFV